MNTAERNEVHELSERMDRIMIWARWLLGALIAVAMSATTYAVTTEGRLSDLEQVALRTKALAEDVAAVQAKAALRSAEMARISATLTAHGKTLDRMDASLAELTRYLRDGGVP